MASLLIFLSVLATLPGLCWAVPLGVTYAQAAIDSGEVLADLNKQAYDTAMKRVASGKIPGCTQETVTVRREWRNMPPQQRIEFVAAVECLQTQQSAYLDVDAAKSAFDDFIVLHYHLTPFVHMSATFFTFHRYYLWTYEHKLRTLCKYKGSLPYWEWGFDTEDPRKSPLFDGSPTSMGSDGKFVQHEGIQFLDIKLPPGTGGGCVEKGPFSNMTVHIGPYNLPNYGSPGFTGVKDPLVDNPRCLKRDLNGFSAKKWASLRNTTRLILDAPNIELFQGRAQGLPEYVSIDPGMGVHGGGHYTIGGDPGGDVYLSPGEPVFYLHHAQLDRAYFIWQNLNWTDRQGIFGTGTMNNQPPSPVQSLDDWLDLSPVNEKIRIGSLIDTVGGSPLCYVYSAENGS